MLCLRTQLIGILLVFVTFADAQVPVTELFLFSINKQDTIWQIHSPKLLSGFNPGGYTNQPEFIAEDLVYVSVRMKGDEQNDIYGLRLSEGTLERVTDTPESEYSPTLVPGKSHFSCIRQNDTDTLDQRVYMYPIDRSGNGRDLLKSQYDIGYHAWVANEQLALFQLGDPPTLAWANLEDNSHKRVLSGIGRCLETDDQGALYYVHKYSKDVWYLKKIIPPSTKSEIIIETLKGSEDFVVAPNGSILSGRGSVLYAYNPTIDSDWKVIADLAPYGITDITRLSLNNSGQLMLVNNIR